MLFRSHFYDDLKKNTDEVENAIAEKEPSELHVYGPGEFDLGEADPEIPTRSCPEKRNEGRKSRDELIMERWSYLAGIKR